MASTGSTAEAARPAGAGYSGTPLPRKLGVKDGHVVLLDRLPDGLDLGLPPTAIVVRRLRDGLDLTVTFHTTPRRRWSAGCRCSSSTP